MDASVDDTSRVSTAFVSAAADSVDAAVFGIADSIDAAVSPGTALEPSGVAAQAQKERYPGLRYHITSGDTEQVTEKLDKGLLDFAVVCSTPDAARYRFLAFPETDRFGLIVPSDHPLSEKEFVTPGDLAGLPLFCSEQSWENDVRPWAGDAFAWLHLEGSFRLAYNGSMFAREGLGFLLTLEHLIDVSPESGLTFVPLAPALKLRFYLIWNRYQSFTPIAERFLEQAAASFSGTE